jgi:hypothetical protein
MEQNNEKEVRERAQQFQQQYNFQQEEHYAHAQ